MDPITLIVAALIAGGMTGIQDTASQAVKDAYEALKALLRHRYADQADVQSALATFEEKPELGEQALKAALLATAAKFDDEIIGAAQRVLSLKDPERAATGKYATHIDGDVQGFVQGNGAQVTMNFNAKPPKK